MKLTELVKQWREEAIRASDEDRYEAVAIIRDCADELEDYIADNKWVQITEDEGTWPDGINLVLSCVNLDDGTLSNPRVMRCGYGKHWIGYWYRPLNDNDYPPKED